MKNSVYLVLSILVTGAVLAGSTFKDADKRVAIASKLFTENILSSEMYTQLIEDRTYIEVVRKQAIGGTSVCNTSMKNGEVDIYVDYTGTIYSEILKYEYDINITPDEIYGIVKQEMAVSM